MGNRINTRIEYLTILLFGPKSWTSFWTKNQQPSPLKGINYGKDSFRLEKVTHFYEKMITCAVEEVPYGEE